MEIGDEQGGNPELLQAVAYQLGDHSPAMMTSISAAREDAPACFADMYVWLRWF